jgi:hypothetical protein
MPGGPISLATAIDEIKAELNARQPEEPFFLMVGAGVSVPVIPLASEIVAECKKRRQDILNAARGRERVHLFCFSDLRKIANARICLKYKEPAALQHYRLRFWDGLLFRHVWPILLSARVTVF